MYLVLSYISTIQCKLTEAKMLKPYLLIANLQDKTPQHLLNTVVVVLGLAICLGIIAGTKEAFGSHMRPKGLPKCTHKLRISVIYYQRRHAKVLEYPIKKMAGHLPRTKLGATQKTMGEPTQLG